MALQTLSSPPTFGSCIWGESAPAMQDLQQGVVLLLFFNIGCTGCTGRTLPFTLDILRAYPQLTILGIHIAPHTGAEYTPVQVRAVAEYYHLPYPVFFDATDASLHTFKIGAAPHWVLLRKRRIRHNISGSMNGSFLRLDYALQEAFGIGHAPSATFRHR